MSVLFLWVLYIAWTAKDGINMLDAHYINDSGEKWKWKNRQPRNHLFRRFNYHFYTELDSIPFLTLFPIAAAQNLWEGAFTLH